MFKNYLTTAFRNLQRNKSYAIINIFGVASCLVIFLVIQFETSFDGFHKNRNDTVGYLAIRAASASPVKSLRTE
jgi:putative ABC transport system permease protein